MSSGAPLRPYGRPFVPVPTGDESAAFDRWAIEHLGVPQSTLMENAGRGAALVLQRLYPSGPVVGVVGGGNNGGDALVALRSLAEWGREVRAILVGDRPDPEPLLHGWPVARRSGEDAGAWQGIENAGAIVDGLLGTGAHGPPRERHAAAIRRINGSGRPVVALDVPSGVDANDGSVAGDAVRADVTVAFGWPKLGALLHPGRALSGRMIALDIGFPQVEEGRFGARLVTPAWARALRPERASDTHKKAVGVLLVIAGAPGMAGAAVLAARGALRAGAGLVRVASAEENRVVLQTAVPGAIFVDGSDRAALEAAVADSTAVAVGPGLGLDAWGREILNRAIAPGSAPLLLDADALNLAASGASPPLAEIARTRPLLVTPHPGEMSRLAPSDRDAFKRRRVDAARAWAAETGCTLLLKGSPSLVAAPGAPVLIDAMGSSDLATAGVGDVLSGVAGALLAQGVGARAAGALGLYLSGRAARLAARGAGMIPEDIVEHLPDALAEEGDGVTDLDLPAVIFDQDPAY
jgi:NAD(P)H-hydrate epimerase